MKAEMPDFLTDRFLVCFFVFFCFLFLVGGYTQSRFLCQYSKAEFKNKQTNKQTGLLGQVLLGD